MIGYVVSGLRRKILTDDNDFGVIDHLRDWGGFNRQNPKSRNMGSGRGPGEMHIYNRGKETKKKNKNKNKKKHPPLILIFFFFETLVYLSFAATFLGRIKDS